MQTDGGKGKETDQLELAALLGWIRTFPLHASATTAADLYDGCTMAEVLVQVICQGTNTIATIRN